MKAFYWCSFFLLILLSCQRDKSPVTPKCPPFDIVPASPYDDPVWHPAGQIIGFNHRPIKEISYSYGYDCPRQASYAYYEDSLGFWLVNADGTGKRRVLPYPLQTPAWSPDGNWIAFVRDAQVYKMPFDGERFDTTALVQLTASGRNFFPAWSPDGNWIAYDNTVCGSATEAPPPNSCGILISDRNGVNKGVIAKGRMPNYINDNTLLYTGFRNELYTMSLNDSSVSKLTALNDTDISSTDNRNPQYSASLRKAAFLSQSNKTGGIGLYTIDLATGATQRISLHNILNFSWSPDGRIVFLRYDYSRIDQVQGTLWVMDADGSNLRQLTYNHSTIR